MMMRNVKRRYCLKWMAFSGLTVFGGAGCRERGRREPDPTFQNDLVKALAAAKRVRIVEHSSPLDWEAGDRNAPERIYREKDLTPGSKAGLIRKLTQMSPALPEAYLACAAAFHHRLEFSDPDAPPLEICFQCIQVKWEGSKGSYPAAIFGVLGDFLEEEGMKRSRDWSRLAKGAQ